jgi:predicted anti-sigma-YlaC factor YlaD
MNCHECQDWLQRRLDGAAPARSSALEQHLAECHSCRTLHASGQALLEGLKAVRSPVPPVHLSERLARMVLQDREVRRRRVRLRLGVTAALAASILVMALVGQFLPPLRHSTGSGHQRIAKENNEVGFGTDKADAFPPLGQSIEDARQAVVSLSELWAERAKKQATILLPADVDVGPIPSMTASLEPAAQSLQKVGQGALDSMEPVAMSARRALTYFLSELPVFDENH